MSLLDLCLLDSHKVQHSSLLVWTSIKSCDGRRLDNISFPKFHLILFLWTVRDEKAYESGTDVVRPLIHITQNSTGVGDSTYVDTMYIFLAEEYKFPRMYCQKRVLSSNIFAPLSAV